MHKIGFRIKVNLILKSGKIIETNYPLKHWIEQLVPFNFAQPYKSFLVNLNQVSNVTTQEIILVNNEVIPLSRLYKKDFENKFIESLKRRI